VLEPGVPYSRYSQVRSRVTTMSDSDNTNSKDKKVDDKTQEIIDMLKEAGVSTENIVDTEHAFWDTQVCSNCTYLFDVVFSKHVRVV
jgi:molybdopterin biosynthesis enzyme MoaB